MLFSLPLEYRDYELVPLPLASRQFLIELYNESSVLGPGGKDIGYIDWNYGPLLGNVNQGF